jgi:hypothetical protein
MKPVARMEYNPNTLYIPCLFSTNIVGSRCILPVSKRLLYSLYYNFSPSLLKNAENTKTSSRP